MAKYVFEWDDEKDVINQKRHGVAFADAQEAFYDKNRIIARDEGHSATEERLFCIGNTPTRCPNRQIYSSRSSHPHHWCRQLEKMEEVL